ncbi:hypothetical protein [uncultured Methylobacterium sp.]|uniref:hypothetical protein n=1 Tax=uncultured Methylobacterium sp. TaxID=157278 RepID=UPI0035CAAD12
MNDPSSSRLYLGEDPCPVPIPRIVARAYVRLVGATALLAVFVFAVASQNSLDAGRIAGAEGGYAASLVSALAVAQSRPPR